jgi:Domain of unknown function (DUF4270)
MKNKFAQSILWASAALLSFFSCTKSTPFGSDLLEDQVADYNAVEIPVNCTVIPEDSVTTSDRNNSFEYFYCGQLNDAEFGVTTSEIFTQLDITSIPNFKNARFDSICMILPYVAAGMYGDTMESQMIQVFELDDTIAPSYNYYSVNSISAGAPVCDPYMFSPRPRTYKKILDTAASTTKLPHLQVNLSAAYAQELMAIDSATMANKFTFWKKSKGLKIVCSVPSGRGCMNAFNLNSTNSFIRLYYTVSDTVHKSADYVFNTSGSNKFMRYAHNYTGTNAGNAMNQTNPDLIYLQGLSGLKMKVEFPTAAADFDKILVNKADLEMTMATDGDYPPIAQLVTYDKQKDSTFVVTSDAAYSLSVTGSDFTLFGGTPQKKTGIYQYHLTMSKRFQKIIDADPGDAAARVIYINIFPQRGSAARNIMYGVNHPTYPMKLRLKYTKL